MDTRQEERGSGIERQGDRRLILVGEPQVHIQHRDEGRYDDQLKHCHDRIIADSGLDCKSEGILTGALSHKNSHRAPPAAKRGRSVPGVFPAWETGFHPSGAPAGLSRLNRKNLSSRASAQRSEATGRTLSASADAPGSGVRGCRRSLRRSPSRRSRSRRAPCAHRPTGSRRFHRRCRNSSCRCGWKA